MAAPRTFPRPVVRWLGGKTRLLSRLLPLLSPPRGRYFEPFVGGAAAFLALSGQLTRPAMLSDANAHLIHAYERLARDAPRVGLVLADLLERHNRTRYLNVRTAWNAGSGDPWWRAGALLYLSRASYGGVWRENADGEHNVPPRPDAPGALRPGALEDAGAAFKRAELAAGDFRDALDNAGAGDLAYLDPPYPPVRKGAFTTYRAGGFGDQDHRDLAQVARAAAARGCRVLLSISDCALALELYGTQGAPGKHVRTIHELAAPRAIGARTHGAKSARELLVEMGPAADTHRAKAAA